MMAPLNKDDCPKWVATKLQKVSFFNEN